MAAIYLHIGLPKTGTTTLQHFMWENQAVFEKNGICFPDFGLRYPGINRFRNAHFLVPYFKKTDEGAHESVFHQLAQLGKRFDRILLSDEVLWRIGDRRPEFWTQIKEAFRQNGLSLQVIVYLRRQDNFLLSLYRQRIKGARTSLPFYDYLNTLQKHYPLDYSAYMDMLSDTLGRENIHIRVYEKEQFRGAEHTLHSDFLDIFGLSLNDGFTITTEKYNEALDRAQLELRRILNMLPEEDSAVPLFLQAFEESRNKDHEDPFSFFHPGDQAACLAAFAESNRRVAKEYLGREDGILFYDDAFDNLPEYHVSTEELLEKAVLFYASIANRQAKEIAELKRLREYVPLYRLKRKLSSLRGKGDPLKEDPKS